MSTLDSAKTASQICQENELPLSSTFKKIRKLCKSGQISVEKINIDDKGKKSPTLQKQNKIARN